MNEGAETPSARPDPLDRIADHALREAHGLHAHPDLTARIVAAWSRGERGTDVAAVLETARRRRAERDVELDDEPEEATLDRREPRSWTRTSRLVLAASVLLVLAAAAAWWWPRSTRIAPIARSEDAVRVFRGAESAELDTRELLPGDIVLTGTGDVAWLDLAQGGRLVLGPCGLLANTADGWSLGRGRVEARDVPRTLALDAGFARIVASPDSAILAEIAVDDAVLACSPVHGPAALRELLARLPQAPRTLHVAVERGGVELEHDGGHETLSSGAERDLDGPTNPARLVTDEGRAEIALRIDALRRGPKLDAAWWTTFGQRERELVADVAKHLEKSPQYWPIARAEIERRLRADDSTPEFVQRCVDLALTAPARDGVPLVRSLWQADASAFREPQIVALAERGLFEFEREARAMVELHEPGAGPPPLWAAIWLANQGDERARSMLAGALAASSSEPLAPDAFDALALAAFTLDHAGDRAAWKRGLDRLQPEVERVFALGMGPAATAMALELRYLDEARRKREVVTPARLVAELDAYLEVHGAEIADEEALTQLLEGLRR